MRVNLQKITLDYSDNNGLEFFKQLNVYKTIDYKSNIYLYNMKVYKIDTTIPKIKILSAKIIKTMEGTSLEGQHLSGKKLIIIGEINASLVVNYCDSYGRIYKICRDINIPFNTFIIIPKDCFDIDAVNLRYLIDDISVVQLCHSRFIVSVTLLLQYLDEYLEEI